MNSLVQNLLKKNILNLEKVIGNKPCFRCDLDVNEYFWDPVQFIMTWKCANL